jgi:hypothetical protein
MNRCRQQFPKAQLRSSSAGSRSFSIMEVFALPDRDALFSTTDGMFLIASFERPRMSDCVCASAEWRGRHTASCLIA